MDTLLVKGQTLPQKTQEVGFNSNLTIVAAHKMKSHDVVLSLFQYAEDIVIVDDFSLPSSSFRTSLSAVEPSSCEGGCGPSESCENANTLCYMYEGSFLCCVKSPYS